MRALPRRLAWLSGFVVMLAVIAGAAEPVPSGARAVARLGAARTGVPRLPVDRGHRAAAAEDFLCAWPGMLELSADDHGADVTQHWRVEVESWIPLPGDAEYWPQQVSVDGQPAPVVDHAGPSVRVAAGSHEIRAHIPWTERPQTLRVPDAIGLVALSVDGKAVVPVQRDGEELTLGRAKTAAPEADSLDVRVYRKITDDVPATLTRSSSSTFRGRRAKITIGPALPDGFAPLALDERDLARAARCRRTTARARATGQRDDQSRSAHDGAARKGRRTRAGGAVAAAGNLELRSGARVARDVGVERIAGRSAPGRGAGRLERIARVRARRRRRC